MLRGVAAMTPAYEAGAACMVDCWAGGSKIPTRSPLLLMAGQSEVNIYTLEGLIIVQFSHKAYTYMIRLFYKV